MGGSTAFGRFVVNWSRGRRRLAAMHALLALLLVGAMVGQSAEMAGAKRHHKETALDPKIVNGRKVPQGQYLFMAALLDLDSHYSGGDTPFDQQFCGGSVIGRRAVLTAAHCMDGMAPEKLKVLIGRSNLNGEGGVIMDVLSIKVNPAYDPYMTANDAAVVLLTRDIPAPYYQPIRVVAGGDVHYEQAGSAATVSGWGSLHQKRDYPLDLYEADIHVLGDDVCGRKASYGSDYVAPTMLCAGESKPARDSCFGDSGGPLFVQTASGPVQIGIVSWGRGCAKPRYPGVYTRLSNASVNRFVRIAAVWRYPIG